MKTWTIRHFPIPSLLLLIENLLYLWWGIQIQILYVINVVFLNVCFGIENIFFEKAMIILKDVHSMKKERKKE